MKFAADITNACCVLHNIAIKRGIEADEIYEDDVVPQHPYAAINHERRELVRNEVIEAYFA